MIETSVEGFDEVKDLIRAELDKFKSDNVVLVGIHEEAGQHDDAEMTNARLGAILNYGAEIDHPAGHTVTIPARPWLIPGVDSANQEYLNIIEKGVENGQTLDDILHTIGVVAAAAVQKYMINLKTPANAESTIKRKGSSNPLRDTGELGGSVTYSVTKGLPNEGL